MLVFANPGGQACCDCGSISCSCDRTAQKFMCRGNACVIDVFGEYTTSNCSGECPVSPPVPPQPPTANRINPIGVYTGTWRLGNTASSARTVLCGSAGASPCGSTFNGEISWHADVETSMATAIAAVFDPKALGAAKSVHETAGALFVLEWPQTDNQEYFEAFVDTTDCRATAYEPCQSNDTDPSDPAAQQCFHHPGPKFGFFDGKFCPCASATQE